MTLVKSEKPEATPCGMSEAIYRRSDRTMSRKAQDGSIAIMHGDNEADFFSIDGLAAEFWCLLDGKASLSRLQEQLALQHRVEVSELAEPVKELIRELIQEKLIEVAR